MKMTILIVKNYPGNNAEIVSRWLENNVEVVSPAEGKNIPNDTDLYSGIIVMGGPQNAHRPAGEVPEAPWFPSLGQTILRAGQIQQPLFGICLGAQLIAEAYGGEVTPCLSGPAFGAGTVSKVHPVDDPLFSMLPDHSAALEWHNSEVSVLPAGADWTLTSEHTAVEAFRLNSAWATQFHFEYQEKDVSEHIELSKSHLLAAGLDLEQVRSEVTGAIPRVTKTWQPIVKRFGQLCEAYSA